jgi:hypothetical protein
MGNAEIINALLNDHDRYISQSPPIRKPDVIVISGDIIQGTYLGDVDYKSTLKAQYQEATSLINDLCNRFVDGDRSRIAICAGNHDVCWNTAFSSMEPITDEELLNRLKHSDFYQPDSQYRWNWKNRTAYEIKDRNLYNSRHDQYWDFMELFYKDTYLPYGLSRNTGYNIFEVSGGRVAIVAFNSTVGNDCFAFHGAIAAADLANCSIKMRDVGQKYALKIAVWHHGIYTPPPNADYMSMDPIFDMANDGYGLGLHGHQHQAAHTVQYLHLPERRRLPIVSAGSLCAGAKELPAGHNRQYNIIEIAEDYATAIVHVRERTKANVFTASMRPEFGINGELRLDIDPPDSRTAQAGLNLAQVTEDRRVAEAEQILRLGKAKEALAILETCDLDLNAFARRLFFEAAVESEAWESLASHGVPPRTLGELASVCDAYSRVKNIDAAIQIADQFNVSPGPDKKMRDEIVGRLIAMKSIGKA